MRRGPQGRQGVQPGQQYGRRGQRPGFEGSRGGGDAYGQRMEQLRRRLQSPEARERLAQNPELRQRLMERMAEMRKRFGGEQGRQAPGPAARRQQRPVKRQDAPGRPDAKRPQAGKGQPGRIDPTMLKRITNQLKQEILKELKKYIDQQFKKFRK